jgi:hypothetical protein
MVPSESAPQELSNENTLGQGALVGVYHPMKFLNFHDNLFACSRILNETYSESFPVKGKAEHPPPHTMVQILPCYILLDIKTCNKCLE